jgi:hypothetical protein
MVEPSAPDPRRKLWAAITALRSNPPRRFWVRVVLASAIGIALGGAFVWVLATDHQGFLPLRSLRGCIFGPTLVVIVLGGAVAMEIRAA